MNLCRPILFAGLVLLTAAFSEAQTAAPAPAESKEARAARMAWFNDARFGLFIHWGVYAVPAGEWQGKTNYGEWIMEHAKIPVSQYEKFADHFNPVKFDAKEWVRLAKDAGMKYIVITSKHHDGFGLWDSKLTDWDIGRTPFKRDPLQELAAACQEAGITLCFYHSIMDWHHPDWGLRRAWHDKATGEPDMDRYTDYMKGQLKELLTGCGPIGILWFDGEWEKPWTHERGVDLYNYVRALQPNIIINNRVGKGRKGMSGMDSGKSVGDYGTPEQEIPPTGFGADVAWESCMTMNNHWGYNKNDQNWKSTQTLIRNLVDCASKGGNYLLNVGPTAEGLIPGPSVVRLAEIGKWMKANQESIHGTQASPFEKLDFGRCTQRPLAAGQTRLYLHVFDRPADGELVLVGLANTPVKAFLLDGGQRLDVTPGENKIVVTLPADRLDKPVTVVALDIEGAPQIIAPPVSTETPAQKDARMKWWREARFGMFIHYGPVTLTGREISWSRANSNTQCPNQGPTPVEVYDNLYKEFNPTNFNAADWAGIAKAAGMKYVVLTAKHGDGFLLWDSKVDAYNITATPFQRDLCAELAQAVRAEGLKLGWYFSPMDWRDPDCRSTNNARFVTRIQAKMRELLTNYGKVDVMWFDSDGRPTMWSPETTYPLVRGLQPHIVINNRLQLDTGEQWENQHKLKLRENEDFYTPEQKVGSYDDKQPWESCMTLGTQWSWKPEDQIKAPAEVIRILAQTVGGDGNLLLNVGPMPDGRIEPRQVEVLRQVGAWLGVNGESIYGTRGGPWKPTSAIASTRKGNAVYVHVLNAEEGSIELPALPREIKAASLLGGGEVKTEVAAGKLTLHFPEAHHSQATVIKLELDGSAIEISPLEISFAQDH